MNVCKVASRIRLRWLLDGMAHRGLFKVNVTANISLIINEIRWYWQICHYFWQLFIFYIDIVCVIVCGKLR